MTTNPEIRTGVAGLPQASVQRETLEGHRPAMERVVQVMHEKMFEELTLEDMAAVACMSPFHFNRVFRALVGIPPGQFLGALRLEVAKQLLLTTDKGILDICYEVGYNSLGTFSSRFTQFVGMAPGQFRQLSLAFEADAEQVLSLVEPPAPPSAGPVLEGMVESERPLTGCIFMGTFDSAIPLARPITCAILAEPGPFRIAVPEREHFYLFAAGMDAFQEPLDFLRTGKAVRGLGSAGPFVPDAGGQVAERSTLRLRPPHILDPPLLIALPPLIDERLAESLQLEDETH